MVISPRFAVGHITAASNVSVRSMLPYIIPSAPFSGLTDTSFGASACSGTGLSGFWQEAARQSKALKM